MHLLAHWPDGPGLWKTFIQGLALMWVGGAFSAHALGGALEAYVHRPDASYNWKWDEQQPFAGGTVTHLELISQTWRGQFWSHHLQVVRPGSIRNPDIALLFITGNGDGKGDLDMLRILAQRAGAVAAVLTQVPNEPLYGRKEDALIAYTFDQYLKTGDRTWPLLFPMVKSAVRAMDTLQAFARKQFHQSIKRFVVSGASKRGWTTWLTGAVDKRVVAIAPIVIDMLNMKAQADWAKKVYGRQSEQIQDYTKLGLIDKLGEPGMVRLRQWVDPYSYRRRYTMPKLLLLGTNDRYWTVDSLRNYWNALPGPKLVYQTPNAGHNLGGGKQAIQTLAAWFEMLADHKALPEMDWEFSQDAQDQAMLWVYVNQPARRIRLWTATSATRDFRDARWTSRDLASQPGRHRVRLRIPTPDRGYRSYLAEVELTSPTGQPYRLSTAARVTPDLRNSN